MKEWLHTYQRAMKSKFPFTSRFIITVSTRFKIKRHTFNGCHHKNVSIPSTIQKNCTFWALELVYKDAKTARIKKNTENSMKKEQKFCNTNTLQWFREHEKNVTIRRLHHARHNTKWWILNTLRNTEHSSGKWTTPDSAQVLANLWDLPYNASSCFIKNTTKFKQYR